MTALAFPETADLGCDSDAYTEFWHAMEDDVRVTNFDDDERDAEDEIDDVYFTYVSSIEA